MPGLNIFINYRRSDTSAWAGRIHDRLVQDFPKESLYMDVDSIPLGADFFEAIDDALKTCGVLLVIIGKDWLNASDEHGRRLDNPDDLVRYEVSTALKQGIRVIPILVNGARLPRSTDLPDELAPMVRRNSFEMRHVSFHADAERLIKAIRTLVGEPAVKSKGPKEEVIDVEQTLSSANEAYKEKDFAKALTLYKAVAQTGNASAQSTLGWMYEKGEGVNQDKQEAIRLYRLSAEQGNAIAQNNLGWMYRKGVDIKQDHQEAVLFTTVLEARVLSEQFRRRYNEYRPHSSLNYETPAAYAAGVKITLKPVPQLT